MTCSATIIYASQTGNAQDVASQVEDTLLRLHYVTKLRSADEYDLQQLVEDDLVLFVISTTGQGDVPDSMKDFWKAFLSVKLPLDLLSTLYFSVFGLGDSSYPLFNWAARKLRRRILQLGATEIVPIAEGNEQHPLGIDSMFLGWNEKIKLACYKLVPLEVRKLPLASNVLLPPRYKIRTTVETAGVIWHQHALSYCVQQNQRLTAPSHWQDVRHLRFAPTGSERHFYAPGDVAVLHPINDAKLVQDWLDCLGWSDVADLPLDIDPVPSYIPTNTSLRTLASHYLDILSIPRRSFFGLLSRFTTDPDHAERLLEFTTPEAQQDLWDYANRPRRTILEILQDFEPGLKGNVPLDRVLDLFPRLRGRQFSIASRNNEQTGAIELCVSIVRYRTIMATDRVGVCSRWLEHLPIGAHVQISLSLSTMHLPLNPSTPIILIGPGTGIAPLRAMIQERTATQANGSMILFAGHRHRSQDFLFGKEWDTVPHLTTLLAFSQDDNNRFKTYVTTRIKENAALLRNSIIDVHGWVYVCGSSGKMPEGVRNALGEVLGGKDQIEALELSGRYHQETW